MELLVKERKSKGFVWMSHSPEASGNEVMTGWSLSVFEKLTLGQDEGPWVNCGLTDLLLLSILFLTVQLHGKRTCVPLDESVYKTSICDAFKPEII